MKKPIHRVVFKTNVILVALLGKTKVVDKVRSSSGPILVVMTNRLEDQCKHKREIKLSNSHLRKAS